MGGVKGQQQNDRERNIRLGRCRLTLRSIAAPTGDVPDFAFAPEICACFLIYAAPIGDVANRAFLPIPEMKAGFSSFAAPIGDVANRDKVAASVVARCDNEMGKRSAAIRPRRERGARPIVDLPCVPSQLPPVMSPTLPPSHLHAEDPTQLPLVMLPTFDFLSAPALKHAATMGGVKGQQQYDRERSDEKNTVGSMSSAIADSPEAPTQLPPATRPMAPSSPAP
jgi:hypothetical protein